jgi:uncharacterized membrane protein
MRLFLYCDSCRHKVYLNVEAKTRTQLARQWGANFNIRCPHCRSVLQYHVNDVRAEASNDGVVPGALIGGLIGLIGGPIGMLTGGTIGGAISNSNAKQEVDFFNNNYY